MRRPSFALALPDVELDDEALPAVDASGKALVFMDSDLELDHVEPVGIPIHRSLDLRPRARSGIRSQSTAWPVLCTRD